ncbi:MAG: type VI secretion system tip protein VgrG [Bryobacterales bacterium]|nr:type VI secretion system tip protein VgrG [Bryobacterales bacterium]
MDLNGQWTYTQANRPMDIQTVRGKDNLLLESMELVEGVSRCYQLECDLLSLDPQIPIDELIRTPVRVRLRLDDDGSVRYIHGYVREVEQLRGWCDLSAYRIVAVPHLWFLNLSEDCRIFQNLSVPEIVEQVLLKHEMKDYRFELHRDYPKHEYCVQYRESDLDFISRLLEEEGIYYSFRHDDKRHLLLFGDYSPTAPLCPGSEMLRFDPVESNTVRENSASDAERRVNVCSDRVSLKDFNFRTPRDPLHVSVRRGQPLEVYDYPGGYERRQEGDRYARLRMEEREAALDNLEAVSGSRTLAPGYRVACNSHPNPQLNRKHFILQVRHVARDNQFRSAEAGAPQEPFCYQNEFLAIPALTPYRPPSRTPKPFIRGSQTAIVTGPDGEEIYTDKYGRVKVQFHWDRLGKYDEHSSCWIRVSNAWAGNRWGAIFLPRIGQEVIVSFLEGDPDQPIITGRVYNGDMMPPYELPANKALSGVKSDTYKGRGYNEIVFDDTAGRELIRIHGMKDRQTRINNDDTSSIGHDRVTEVANDDKLQVGNNQITIVGANASEQVALDKEVKVGQNLLIEAGTSITLKCGPTMIHMNQAGVVNITGLMINIAGGINANLTAPLTTVSGVALMTAGVLSYNAGASYNAVGGVTNIKGGPVRINS